jgi:hypothetical protein
MGNTEGGRLHRRIDRQIYFDRRPGVIQTCCPPRTTLSTEITPAESSRYTAHACDELVDGRPTGRKTYQAGVSQEQIQALLAAASRVKNYASESIRLSAESAACPGYIPPFTNTIPPLVVCPPLPPPPAPPLIPGVNPRQCVNRIY